MTEYIKLLCGCLLAVILSQSIKKFNPEISFLIMIASILGCITILLSVTFRYKDDLTEVFHKFNLSFTTFAPMFKCLTISCITHLASGICKDGGHSATACSLELTGNLIMIICMIPLFETLFQVIGGLI